MPAEELNYNLIFYLNTTEKISNRLQELLFYLQKRLLVTFIVVCRRLLFGYTFVRFLFLTRLLTNVRHLH